MAANGNADGSRPTYEVSVDTLRQLLAADVMRDIERKTRVREQQRWTRLGLILSLVAALGLGSVTWSVRALITQIVDTELSDANSEYIRLMDFETTYQEFISLSLSVVDDTGEFLRGEILEDAVGLLEELSSSSDLIVNRITFDSHLERLLSAAIGGNAHTSVDRIDDLFRTTIVGMPMLFEKLTIDFGVRVLSSAVAPADQPRRLRDRLIFYTESSRESLDTRRITCC